MNKRLFVEKTENGIMMTVETTDTHRNAGYSRTFEVPNFEYKEPISFSSETKYFKQIEKIGLKNIRAIEWEAEDCFIETTEGFKVQVKNASLTTSRPKYIPKEIKPLITLKFETKKILDTLKKIAPFCKKPAPDSLERNFEGFCLNCSKIKNTIDIVASDTYSMAVYQVTPIEKNYHFDSREYKFVFDINLLKNKEVNFKEIVIFEQTVPYQKEKQQQAVINNEILVWASNVKFPDYEKIVNVEEEKYVFNIESLKLKEYFNKAKTIFGNRAQIFLRLDPTGKTYLTNDNSVYSERQKIEVQDAIKIINKPKKDVLKVFDMALINILIKQSGMILCKTGETANSFGKFFYEEDGYFIFLPARTRD